MELPILKRCEESSWLKEIHSQVLQQSLKDLDSAFQHFFRRLKTKEKPGYPRFRNKFENNSFRYPQGVKTEDSRVFLPKIGWVRFRKSREIHGTIKQTTVIQEGAHWYVCFSCQYAKEAAPEPDNPSVAGIDLGLENFAIVASEAGVTEFANPRFLKSDFSHLRFLSRQFSKKKKGSQAWKKAKQKLRSFHVRLRNKRQDFLHKLSTALVKSHDQIVVESLKVKSLLKKAPRALARAISDAGWRQFLGYLKYKCEHSFKGFLEAGDYFPSTKKCHACGTLNEMQLGNRQYRCSCGVDIHRDHNSAIVLRAVGTTV